MKLKLHIQILLLLLAGLFAYSNTFSVPFTFDDKEYIIDNPVVSDFKYLADLEKARLLDLGFNVRVSLSTRYAAYLSFLLNRKLGGLNPAGYHVVNLAIHLINCTLVFFLVRLLLSLPQMAQSKTADYKDQIAFGAGLLFAVHPIQTEAVTYISQRFTSLVALFYLSAIYFYIKSMDSKRRGFYMIAVLATVFAMKTKETAFTIPLMMTIADFVFFDAGWRKRIKRLALFYLSALIVPISLIWADTAKYGLVEKLFSISRTQTDMPRIDYLFTELPVVVTYLRLLILPINQNIDYDLPIYDTFFSPAVVGSFFTLAVVIIFGVQLIRKAEIVDPALRVAGFGIFWFFAALLVESSLIPIRDVIFEHRVYLSSVGIFTSFVIGAFIIAERFGEKGARYAFISLIIICGVFGVATFKRNLVWGSETALWEDTVRKSPKKARPHNNLGKAYLENGHLDKALSEFNVTLGINPNHALARANRGLIYEAQGFVVNATADLEEAVRLLPRNPGFRESLGKLHVKQGLQE